MNFEYQIKKATEKEIYLHLNKCSKNFIPPLDQRVNIQNYAEKIFTQSVTFEAWNGGLLAGLVAAYFNYNPTGGFITNVSVINNLMGLGLSSKLLGMCLKYGKENYYKKFALEVNSKNTIAVSLYKKFGFEISGMENENLKMILELK